MNRDEKAAVVATLSEQISSSDAVFAVDYRGLSVSQAAELRTRLRDADASFRVIKNRLTIRALDDAGEGARALEEHLSGPTALTFVNGDVALAAKALRTYAGEVDKLEFKGGVMGDQSLDADQIGALARMPGRDQLNAQLAGIVASPLTGVVRGLAALVQGLASQLGQIRDQGLVSDEPSSADGEVEEAAEPAAAADDAPESAEPDPDG